MKKEESLSSVLDEDQIERAAIVLNDLNDSGINWRRVVKKAHMHDAYDHLEVRDISAILRIVRNNYKGNPVEVFADLIR